MLIRPPMPPADESGFAEEVEDVEVTEPELDEDTATNDDEEEDA